MQSAKEILNDLRPVNPDNNDWIIAAMHVYAAQAITEQLEVAAKELCPDIWDINEVDRKSITSCTRIELP